MHYTPAFLAVLASSGFAAAVLPREAAGPAGYGTTSTTTTAKPTTPSSTCNWSTSSTCTQSLATATQTFSTAVPVTSTFTTFKPDVRTTTITSTFVSYETDQLRDRDCSCNDHIIHRDLLHQPSVHHNLEPFALDLHKHGATYHHRYIHPHWIYHDTLGLDDFNPLPGDNHVLDTEHLLQHERIDSIGVQHGLQLQAGEHHTSGGHTVRLRQGGHFFYDRKVLDD
ncbi:hypothetical protein LTR27_009278 [Elasticomyces elasticus]|nr:hypothetical protein LTR27_009278 [Elasticomyces elasticus]